MYKLKSESKHPVRVCDFLFPKLEKLGKALTRPPQSSLRHIEHTENNFSTSGR